MRVVDHPTSEREGHVGSAKKKSVSSRTGAEASRRAQRFQQRRVAARRKIIALVGGALFLALIVPIVLQVTDSGGAKPAQFAGSTLNLVLGDYTIVGDLTAPAGAVRLQAVNNGGIAHNVGVRRGPISANLETGESATVVLGVLAAGTYQLYCDIVNHVEQGMVADLIITEPISTSSVPAVSTT
jgi:sulfocyanin SoxE-like protein